MNDPQEQALTTLRDIDARFHRLFEAVSDTDDPGSQPDHDPLRVLQRAQAQIDAALFAHQHTHPADTTQPTPDTCLLQWTPDRTPPRRLVLDPTTDGDSWTRRELEWTGTGWRTCGRTTITDLALTIPAEARYPTPLDPPTLDTLLTWIRSTWTRPDPAVLVFPATPPTSRSVVAAVDGELRYREIDGQQWFTVTSDALRHHLQQHGQPQLQALSDTPLTRMQFTPSPLTQ